MPRRPILSVLAALAVVVGIALTGAVIIVRTVVLDPATYTTALVRTDAYTRVYTEVLADPELADLKEDLLGDLGVPAELAVQARSLGINALRWVLPPATLRAGTESVVAAGLAYVRGDTPRLRPEVAVATIADRVPTTTVRQVRALLASAADRTVASADELAGAVRDVADQLAAGQVPATIPKVGGTTFDPDDVAAAIMDGLDGRVDDDVRRMVTATVLAGDQRDAVIDAVAGAVAAHAATAAARLRAEPTIDVAAVVAAHAEHPVGALVATFDDARELARWTGTWTAVAGVALAAAGALALAALHGRGRRLVWWLAASSGATGVVVAGGWLITRNEVRSPLAAAGDPGPGGWGLPPATAALLADVVDAVGDRIAGAAWRCGAVLVLAGAALAGGAALWRAVRTVPVRRVALAAVAIVTLTLFSAIVGTRERDARACNGHVELCDRPYDDVVQAATHNAMSSPDVVPVWPEHDGGLTAQLDAGIRTLLIDTHHWPPLESAAQLAALGQPGEPPLPPALGEALLRQVVTVRDGRPGAFLCHIHCAFGAQPLVDGLAEVAAFLAANPDDVVTLVIEDGIPAAETAAAFDAAGLAGFVHAQRRLGPWPTLGELIDRGERLVVFAENEGPPRTGTPTPSTPCRRRRSCSCHPTRSRAPRTAATRRPRCSS